MGTLNTPREVPMPIVESVSVREIPVLNTSEPGEAEWKPVRHHFGIASFGANAYVAHEAGEAVVAEHTEVDDSGTEHEELYLVASGRATFSVADEEVDAPAGTFVYVRDPRAVRSAVAQEPGTVVVAVGGTPGQPFSVSPWERKYTGE
jgi:hypothetical protein